MSLEGICARRERKLNKEYTMSFIYENFYIKAPVAMLEAPLPLNGFKKKDENGVELDPAEYMTIPEYLSTFNHTVERFTNDGAYFLKGFGFNLVGIDELRGKLMDFGLELDTNIWILSPAEVRDELAKPEWQAEEPAA